MERLQVQIAVDEEAVRKHGEQYERSVRRSAYSAIADKMMESHAVEETIIDPSAEGSEEYERYRMKRYYRFSVAVGRKTDAEDLLKERQAGRAEALAVLKKLLPQPNDYEGEVRARMLRWLEKMTPEILTYALAESEA